MVGVRAVLAAHVAALMDADAHQTLARRPFRLGRRQMRTTSALRGIRLELQWWFVSASGDEAGHAIEIGEHLSDRREFRDARLMKARSAASEDTDRPVEDLGRLTRINDRCPGSGKKYQRGNTKLESWDSK